MKRLVKKAEIDYSVFMTLLLNDNVYSQEEVAQVISENPDCVYNGEAFRIFFFDAETVKNAKYEYLKSINAENNFNVDIFEMLWGTLENLIEVNGQYQSYAKSESGIQSVDNHQRDGQEFGITIKHSVSNALDVKKLYEKYKDQLSDEAKEAFSYFESQEEVLAKLDVEDYYYAGGIDTSILRSL